MKSVTEIPEAEEIRNSYVRRILQLALMASDVVEATLAGRTNQALILERLGRAMPPDCEEQQRASFR